MHDDIGCRMSIFDSEYGHSTAHTTPIAPGTPITHPDRHQRYERLGSRSLINSVRMALGGMI